MYMCGKQLLQQQQLSTTSAKANVIWETPVIALKKTLSAQLQQQHTYVCMYKARDDWLRAGVQMRNSHISG